MIKKRTRPQPRVRFPSPDPSDSVPVDKQQKNVANNEDEAELPVSELLELRKFRRARQGIDSSTLIKGDIKKKRRRKSEDGGENEPAGGLQPGAQMSEDSDSDDPEDNAAKMRRAVRANNFTQQTNALDVDKHMMAYIEENMKLRSAPVQESTVSSTATGTSAATTGPGAKNDDLFSNLDPRYKVERKPGEEGSVTNSLSMLTAIPEVDLGMDTRLRNIEETEKAKLLLSHGRSRDRKQPDDEAHLAATRFYRPTLRAKSDADIIRDARREALGLPPAHEEGDRSRGPRMATDEMVMERFKKRMRK
ncbi:hepatocellular carcinoma-associated antigen 59-domain-containing protein [Multifurca ochricompacta]|uniref:Hepatocellular carcinoma-associated antigen 59-domain-containing protein n=1 Tax=Multifurca ochricompacta TaxID=376703 RepID=A0AAD4QE99_9AGAM|nr:hepatocellular carcinoma-associated antigen 59-domain-containing protein [Multifurca ochricompacta]